MIQRPAGTAATPHAGTGHPRDVRHGNGVANRKPAPTTGLSAGLLALMAGAALGRFLDDRDTGAIIGAAAGLAIGLAVARCCATRLVAGAFEPCVEKSLQTPTRSPIS